MNAIRKDISTFSSGWYLLGSGSSITVANIVDANPNVAIIWVYSQNKWTAYSPQSDLATLITDAGFETFNQINRTDGFWIYIK